jgi:hypothetical protein
MTELSQTALESELLALFYELYGHQGFPPPQEIRVLSRENTGGGRYVELECRDDVKLHDVYLDMGGRYISMKSLPSGMMAVVQIKNHKVSLLELAVYGGDHWDGTEKDWAIV